MSINRISGILSAAALSNTDTFSKHLQDGIFREAKGNVSQEEGADVVFFEKRAIYYVRDMPTGSWSSWATKHSETFVICQNLCIH